MDCNSLKGNEAQAGDAHLSLPAQLSCCECKFPPSFSSFSCLQTAAPTVFCSESKTCCKFVVQVCDIIPPILPWRKVAALLPQAHIALCSCCACAGLPLPSQPSPGLPTRIPVTAGMVAPGHGDKCGSGAMPRWQQGPSRVFPGTQNTIQGV